MVLCVKGEEKFPAPKDLHQRVRSGECSNVALPRYICDFKSDPARLCQEFRSLLRLGLGEICYRDMRTVEMTS